MIAQALSHTSTDLIIGFLGACLIAFAVALVDYARICRHSRAKRSVQVDEREENWTWPKGTKLP